MAYAQKAEAAASPNGKFANRILVVDDESASRDLCRDFLESDGYAVETTDRVRKALALLSIKPFDLVITDLSMPELGGIELVKEIRTHHPNTSIMIMTAFGSVMSAVESMKAGAFDYITKPFPRDLLRAAVKRCLESRNLKREISQMQAELFKKDKLAAVGSMAGAIAHRMRNPLSIIQMCAQYLISKTKEDEHVQVLTAITEKVKTLESLTRDFVEYSRASRIRKSPQSIEKLADEVIRNVSPRCKIQGVDMVRNYQKNLPLIPVDADLIKEVLTNLIDNGLEAMKGEGRIRVSIERDGGKKSILVFITNTGDPLKEELQDKIFEPFFTTKETGMGLGLAIVKQVIEGHGGKIAARGDAKTKTTTFYIQLPIGETDKTHA